MKIGILCYPTYGGSGIVATELGMSLANKGYEVHFISSNLPARLDVTNPNIFFHKVNVQTYPLFQYQPYDIALSSMIYRVVNLTNSIFCMRITPFLMLMPRLLRNKCLKKKEKTFRW